MIWKVLELKDKDLFKPFYSETEVSDLSFTNLLLWRFARKIEYSQINNLIYIKTTYPEQDPYFFFPLGKVTKQNFLISLSKIFTDSQKKTLTLKAVTKNQLTFLQDIFGKNISFESELNHFDYIYPIKEMTFLEGRKYHKKKNQLNYFKNNYCYTVETLSEDNLEEVKNFSFFWLQHKQDENNQITLTNEYQGIISVLENFRQLAIRVLVLRVDEKVIGFSISEKLNSNTALIHIEKANSEYKGAYQALNQLCLEKFWQDLKFVNREEDLGLESLRKSKLSYHPSELREKFKVILEKN